MEKRYFLPITWLNLRRSAVKVSKANWGQGFQKCGLFLPLVKGHVTRRMQWLSDNGNVIRYSVLITQ